jgi:hypothetical protein
MQLIQASHASTIDRCIGYYEPYATSHEALDKDKALHAEGRNAARTLVEAVTLLRSRKLPQPGQRLEEPRPKCVHFATGDKLKFLSLRTFPCL